MATRTDRAKLKKLAEQDIARVRAWLNDADQAVRKGRLFAAYRAFRGMQNSAYIGASNLSRATLPAALDWGHAVSMRDSRGKHTGFAIMADE